MVCPVSGAVPKEALGGPARSKLLGCHLYLADVPRAYLPPPNIAAAAVAHLLPLLGSTGFLPGALQCSPAGPFSVPSNLPPVPSSFL